MLKIGYVGYGFVGKACHAAFEHNSHAFIVDPKHTDLTIEDLVDFNPQIIFVAINAPTLDDRSVDAAQIYKVFKQLSALQYLGLVVLKSTLPPAIVDDLYEKYGSSKVMKKIGSLRYIYSPEFLRENSWREDALNPTMIILAGDFFDMKELREYYEKHSHIRHLNFQQMDYKEAALAKYTINAFLANKVVFMNQIYQLYADMYDAESIHPETWDYFVDTLKCDLRLGVSHMDVPGLDKQFGYGGSCFPKDVKAMIGFDTKERLSVLRESELANTKIRLIQPIAKDEDR
jgi:UDP-glucose 6-dehydrogenase